MGIYAEFHSLVDQFRNRDREMNKRIGEIESEFKGLENRIEALEPEDPEELKDPLPYDRHDKPEGGLEPGDVLEYHSPRYQKRIGAIFIGQTSEQGHSGWIEAYRVCDGEVVVIDIELDECKFKFRPKFPEKSLSC